MPNLNIRMKLESLVSVARGAGHDLAQLAADQAKLGMKPDLIAKINEIADNLNRAAADAGSPPPA